MIYLTISKGLIRHYGWFTNCLSFMDGRGSFSAAAFLIDYEDRLFTTIVQSATGPKFNSGNSENC